MIGYITGKVSLITADYCFVETAGIGYRVFMTGTGITKLERGCEVKLFTYMNVREDAILLYGFLDYEEYDMFVKLITVSGIGPKVALGMLSAITPDAFRIAVLSQDLKALTKLPGVGKKTAERLLLELRDKLGFSAEEKSLSFEPSTGGVANSAREEALQALLALGYDSCEVLPVLKGIAQDDLPVAELIKGVLKGLARR